MGRSKHLTKAEKETIAFLCKKRYPVGKIARLVGRNRRSVNRYKNYRLPGAKKDIHTYIQKETYDASKEQAVFQMFYDECKKGNQYIPESVSLFLVHGRKGDRRYRFLRKFEKLPRYKNKSRQEIINDVADIVFRTYKGRHDKVILSPI